MLEFHILSPFFSSCKNKNFIYRTQKRNSKYLSSFHRIFTYPDTSYTNSIADCSSSPIYDIIVFLCVFRFLAANRNGFSIFVTVIIPSSPKFVHTFYVSLRHHRVTLGKSYNFSFPSVYYVHSDTILSTLLLYDTSPLLLSASECR